MKSDAEVVIIGGGAAGVAAGRHLHDAGIDCLIVEARNRLGGRAFTETRAGCPIDLGCGWLHSADKNEWTEVAKAQGRKIDETPPPWARSSLGFRVNEQADYRHAFNEFEERVGKIAHSGKDAAVADALEPNGRWNGLIGAVVTFISGGEARQVSALDYENYAHTDVNWRVVEGYGATIARHGEGVPVAFDSPVRRIDHSGKRLAIETAKGTITAGRAIVTLPTTVLAEMEDLFTPALPDKVDAACNLPLGLDDKMFIALDRPEQFEKDSRLFGAKDDSKTAAYHIRPFGRAMIEGFFGGANARELEAAGKDAFFDFAVSELTAILGNDFAKRLKPITIHRWAADPFARGAYSYAKPGKAGSRAVLAAPVDDRLFFAGEACSTRDYSTAHGAYRTGIAAAKQVIAARKA
ncbi:MAG TPA: NAD(P)/FAD-dependent oxidoreductase [Pseudolabrys sp.]|nr:NAD(P)/FAD-dependent oxidoreductase [Pseudolabrys sp.]